MQPNAFVGVVTLETCHLNYAGSRIVGEDLPGELQINFVSGGAELRNVSFTWLNQSCLSLNVDPIAVNISSIAFRVADARALGYCAGLPALNPSVVVIIISSGDVSAREDGGTVSVSLLSNSAFGFAFFEVQVVGMASRSRCAPAELQANFGHLRFVSPLAFWESEDGGLAGTLIVLILTGTIFVVVALVLAVTKPLPADTEIAFYGTSRRLMISFAKVSSGVWFHILLAVLPGLLFVSSQLTISDSDLAGLGAAIAIVFVLILLAAPALTRLFISQSSIPVTYHGAGTVARLLYPNTLSLPRGGRQVFGVLTAWRHPSALLSTVPLIMPTVLGLAMGLAGNSSSCNALYGSMAAISAMLSIFIGLVRPHRVLFENILNCTSFALTSIELVICAIFSQQEGEDVTSLKSLLIVLLCVHAEVAIAGRVLLPVWLVYWGDSIADQRGTPTIPPSCLVELRNAGTCASQVVPIHLTPESLCCPTSAASKHVSLCWCPDALGWTWPLEQGKYARRDNRTTEAISPRRPQSNFIDGDDDEIVKVNFEERDLEIDVAEKIDAAPKNTANSNLSNAVDVFPHSEKETFSNDEQMEVVPQELVVAEAPQPTQYDDKLGNDSSETDLY